jgi:hypothetical protein
MPAFKQTFPESNLVSIIKDEFLSLSLIKRDGADNFSIQNEFKSLYGIPDLIFYKFNQPSLQKRLQSNINPIVSRKIIKTLILIQGRKKVSLSFLEEQLPYSKKTIREQIIKYLTRNNFLCKSTDNNTFWVENEYQHSLQKLYSIEAKVSNWKRGFYQAYRYKWFSHYSFLALHKKYINPAIKSGYYFKKYNIGLIMIDTINKSLNIIHLPAEEKPYSKEFQAFAFEKLFSDYLERKTLFHNSKLRFPNI